jgi:phosphoribosylanthranilate isomerase
MLDYIQLHGAETPERVHEIKQKYMLPVMKALPVSSSEDLQVCAKYKGTADILLLDAKAQDGSFGGSGESFDWDMLCEFKAPCPWLLAGGLSAENVRQALDICAGLPHFLGVDVSSGVEVERGRKDEKLIEQFLNEVKAWQNAEK